MPQYVAIIKTSKYQQANAPAVDFKLTSLEILHTDGRDCGVPLYVKNYDEAAELLVHLGVDYRELAENRLSFEEGNEVRIRLSADDYIIADMGFDPRAF